jgi:hypothetical protein
LSSFTHGSATKYGIIVFRGSGFRYTETVVDRTLETDAVIDCAGAHGGEGMQEYVDTKEEP